MGQIRHHYLKIVTGVAVIVFAEVIVVLVLLMQGKTFAILQPAGAIARQQKDLLLFASALSLLVVIPVFVLLGFILWRYRDGNTNATYRPNWDGSKRLESIWWGFPIAIIIVLAVVTYQTSHSLDPYRPLASDKAPVRVQVVSLQWKWLFIYPDQNIATINYLQIPEDRPINFEITSDAPMNSFWIPQLGGQVYAMTGMRTKLHLIADEPGKYVGKSANISGEGFAGMQFDVVSTTDKEFDRWVLETSEQPGLTKNTYEELRAPSEDVPASVYSIKDKALFETIIAGYSHKSSTDQRKAVH